jgi:hypothetical protein
VDADRFDLLARSLVTSSRRGLSRALAGLGIVGGLSPLLAVTDAEAKKKRKKKKKKCKKSQKKCGKKCIPKTSCCTSADCGGGATCQNGACLCPSGQKDCQGACVPEDDCCPACTGGRVCVAETCECPTGQQDCQGTCIPNDECCPACAAGQVCDSGFCVCAADTIDCGEFCCDPADEICHVEDGFIQTCEAGGCPATDWCNVVDEFKCQVGCACTTTAGPMAVNACVDTDGLSQPANCTPCATNGDCGAGAVCVPGNDGPSPNFCGCGNNFCVPLCSAGLFNSADRAATVSPKGGSASRGDGKQRAGSARRGHKRRR